MIGIVMLLVALSLCAGGVLLWIKKPREQRDSFRRRGLSQTGLRMIGGSLASVGLLIGLLSFITAIPAGHVGVPVLFGQVQEYMLASGLNVVNPFLWIQKMDVRTHEYTMTGRRGEGRLEEDDSISALSSDGLELTLDVTVWYRLLSEKAPYVYKTIGPDYEAKIVRPAIRTAIRDAAVLHIAQDVYKEKRKEMVDQVKERLVASFDGRGVVLENVLLRNVQLPKKVATAIEDKLKADQEAQQMVFVLEKERQEAKRKEIEAQGISKFQDIVAKGISEQLLQWKGIEATRDIAMSPNAKVIIVGGKDGMPLILNTQ